MSIYIVRADGLLFSAKQLEAVSRLHACRDLGGIVEGVAWVRDNGDIVTENTIRNENKKDTSAVYFFSCVRMQYLQKTIDFIPLLWYIIGVKGKGLKSPGGN